MSIDLSFFRALLPMVESAAENPVFQEAAIGLLKALGSHIGTVKNHPDEVARVSEELVKGAPAIVSAIVAGTPVEQAAH